MGKEFKAETKELIEALKHPAESVRLVAQRRIADRGAEAIPMLVALLSDAKAPAYARWFAIWTLDRIDKGTAGRDAILKIAKSDAEFAFVPRRFVSSAHAARRKRQASALNRSAIRMRKIRFQATALGRIGDSSAVPALVAKLNETDFFTQYAMFTAMHRIGTASPAAWAEVIKGLASTNNNARAPRRTRCETRMTNRS